MSPRPRFSKLEPQKQDEILDAATAEFAGHGFEAASFNRIIAHLGLSKGAVYYYFDDKGDLFATVLSRVMERVMAAVGAFDALETTRDFWGEMERMMERTLAYYQRHPHIAELVWRILRATSDKSAASPVIEKVSEALRGRTERLLARGQELGAVRADLPVAFLVDLAHAVAEVNGRWAIGPSKDFQLSDLERTAHNKLDLMRRVLEPRPPPTAPPSTPDTSTEPEG